jgi:hypothetical protein
MMVQTFNFSGNRVKLVESPIKIKNLLNLVLIDQVSTRYTGNVTSTYYTDSRRLSFSRGRSVVMVFMA